MTSRGKVSQIITTQKTQVKETSQELKILDEDNENTIYNVLFKKTEEEENRKN